MEDNVAKVQKNLEKYEKIIEQVIPDRSVELLHMIEENCENFVQCPGTMKNGEGYTHPGGLMARNLKILKNAIALNDAMGLEIPKDSIAIVCLFFDFGLVGSPGKPLIVFNDSEWSVNKTGQLYKFSQENDFMLVEDRNLFLMQKYGIQLTREEFVSMKFTSRRRYDWGKSYHIERLPFLLTTAFNKVTLDQPKKAPIYEQDAESEESAD